MGVRAGGGVQAPAKLGNFCLPTLWPSEVQVWPCRLYAAVVPSYSGAQTAGIKGMARDASSQEDVWLFQEFSYFSLHYYLMYSQALEVVAQSSCAGSIPGSLEDPTGQKLEESAPVWPSS